VQPKPQTHGTNATESKEGNIRDMNKLSVKAANEATGEGKAEAKEADAKNKKVKDRTNQDWLKLIMLNRNKTREIRTSIRVKFILGV